MMASDAAVKDLSCFGPQLRHFFVFFIIIRFEFCLVSAVVLLEAGQETKANWDRAAECGSLYITR